MKRVIFIKIIGVLILSLTLSACGFHLRGEWSLPPNLQKIYIDTNNLYGQLSNELKQQLKSSNVLLVDTKDLANIVLHIEQDDVSQTLLGLNATQQTRQYRLTMTIRFSLQDKDGVTILPMQTIQDNRIITIQSSQILGSSNEINLFTQQMQRGLAYTMLNRLESQEVAQLIEQHFTHTKTKQP